MQASAWATRKSRDFKHYVRRVGEFGDVGSLPSGKGDGGVGGGGESGGTDRGEGSDGGEGGVGGDTRTGSRSGGVREEEVELEECGCTRTLLVQGTRSYW